MTKFLLQMFSEPGGKPSSTRALAAVACLSILGVWSYTSVKKGELLQMHPEHVAIVLGALGVRAWQRGRENALDDQPSVTTKA